MQDHQVVPQIRVGPAPLEDPGTDSGHAREMHPRRAELGSQQNDRWTFGCGFDPIDPVVDDQLDPGLVLQGGALPQVEDPQAKQQGEEGNARRNSRVHRMGSSEPQQIREAVRRDDRERHHALGVVDRPHRMDAHVGVEQTETERAEDPETEQAGEAVGPRTRGDQHHPEGPEEPDREHEGVVAGVGAEPIPQRVALLVDDRRAGVVESRRKQRVAGDQIRVREHQRDGDQSPDQQARQRS